MHPLFANRATLGPYAGLWLAIYLLLVTALHTVSDADWPESLILCGPACLLYALMCLTPWYLCKGSPSPGKLFDAAWWRMTGNLLGASIVMCALWIGALQLTANFFDLAPVLRPMIPLLITVGFQLYAISIATHFVWLSVEAQRAASLLARDAELRALKSQVNPHFLFNCLNSISALTTSDPGRARDMCVKLSDFLRNTLGLGERESITWKEELDLTRTYLEVERVRFGTRLAVDIQVDDTCTECRVPALLLQPLVENAIKHGIATLVDGGVIRLESRMRGGTLEVSVENEFDPDAPAPRRSGLGLRNVRDRLRARFGANASIMTTIDQNVFRAEMRFPCSRGDF